MRVLSQILGRFSRPPVFENDYLEVPYLTNGAIFTILGQTGTFVCLGDETNGDNHIWVYYSPVVTYSQGVFCTVEKNDLRELDLTALLEQNNRIDNAITVIEYDIEVKLAE